MSTCETTVIPMAVADTKLIEHIARVVGALRDAEIEISRPDVLILRDIDEYLLVEQFRSRNIARRREEAAKRFESVEACARVIAENK